MRRVAQSENDAFRVPNSVSPDGLSGILHYCESCKRQTPHEILNVVGVCLVCHDAALLQELDRD
jgi:hypothetical protein